MSGTAGPVRRVEFSTRSEAEAEDFIRRLYVGNRVRFLAPRDRADYRVTAGTAAGIGADRTHSTVGIAGHTEPYDFYVFVAAHRGRIHYGEGDRETDLLPGECGVFPLGIPLAVKLVDVDGTSLRLPAERLQMTAAEIAGVRARELRFTAAEPVTPAMARHWLRMMRLVATTILDDAAAMAHPLLVEELTRAVAISALHTFPSAVMNREGALAVGRVGPAALRRAVAFIEDNAHRPITLSEIAAAGGTTGRALQYAFHRHHGTTPMAYLRRVRLQHARRELARADPGRGPTVADVARRWGFASTSGFTRAFREEFGRTPSDILRR